MAAGFECEFVEEPPSCFQSECPICLLILRDPYQVTCCGKSFCKVCIQKIKANNQRCPTCKDENFEHYTNLGLKQPLYGFKVYCCNKAKGCDWQGELGQLDQHLNLDPDEDKQLIGCAFAEIQCLYCIYYNEVYERGILENHQQSECSKRPFTCSMCKAYESTYEDVTNHHVPVCECRPVECPNSCGDDNLQLQQLEEHVSNQCPLSLVECEFSHAGCDIKVCRKDLHSHLSDSMVTHMSLLARENRDLKLQLTKQIDEVTLQNKEIKDQAEEIKNLTERVVEQTDKIEEQDTKIRAEILKFVSRAPPLNISFQAKSNFRSEPFYGFTGHKLQLEVVHLESNKSTHFSFDVLESEFKVQSPCTLSVTAFLVDQANGKDHLEYRQEVNYPLMESNRDSMGLKPIISKKPIYLKNDHLILRITDIRFLA